LKTPSGSEPEEWEKTGLQLVECTLIGSNSSAKTTPPTELFPMHFTHLYFAVNREIQNYYKKVSLFRTGFEGFSLKCQFYNIS
jgi:hypothetical protein